MCYARRMVSDAVWARYATYRPGRRPGAWGGAYPKYDNRTVLEAVLWIARAGSPGCDLPVESGPWDTICQRCHRRCQDGVFSGGRFERLTADREPDWDTVMVDGTNLRQSASAWHGRPQSGCPHARRLLTAGRPRPLASVAGD